MKRTVINMLAQAAEKYKNSPFTSEKSDSGWIKKSFSDVHNDSTSFAKSLIEAGLLKDDKISILAEGRINWITGEFAVLKAGCVSVPLSIKLMPEEILFRLNHSESKAIMISKNNIDKIFPIWNKITTPDFKIIYLDADIETVEKCEKELNIKAGNQILVFNELLERGYKANQLITDEYNKRQELIAEDDVVTISYTSGTTGNPKGIMLTHLNYWANSNDALNFFKLEEYFRLLVILPLDHSFAHTVGTYIALLDAVEISFVDARGGGVNTLKNIPINLKEVAPDFLLTVPALSGNFMKKIKDGIDAKGGFVKWLFYRGLKSGNTMFKDGFNQAGIFTKLIHYLPYKLAEMLIYKKVQQIFGGKCQFCVGGGALLDIKQQHFFYSIGVPIFQGYGLTEATPIISANCSHTHKLGTSGKVLPGIECKIIKTDGTEAKTGEKGEIVIRGLNVMKGYYKNEKATQETIRNGWLYTGDMGYFDEDDFLVVVGREKALLISQDGEKYSPEGIEEAIADCSELVSQVMLYNDHSKYTTALITLEKGKLNNYARKHKITDPAQLLEVVKDSFFSFKSDNDFKNQFPEKWIPSVFRIIEEPFSEQNQMINSTMKMVRFKIAEVYKSIINQMYEVDIKTNTQENIEVIKKLMKD